MLKKVSYLCIALIFIIISGIPVKASSTPEIHLELEYVDDYGWNAEYLNFKFPLAEDALDDIRQMLVFYSLDGVTYQPVINPRMGDQWDLLLYSYGEFDNNSYVCDCMNSATTPLKEFLAGEIDVFFIKTELISDWGNQYTTVAKLERNSESIALPDYCTAEVSYPRSITEMFRDENGQLQTIASQHVEIPQGTTREEILLLLPDSYNMEVIIIEDGYNLLGELTVSYLINWNIPENLETLVPGEYIVKVDNTVIPPAEKQIFKKGLQQYYFTASSTDIPLHLVLTVTESDANSQSPPPSDQEETGGTDESYGSGGNRGDVGNSDIDLEKPQPESPSESQPESPSEPQPALSKKPQPDFQSESRQESYSNPDRKITGSNATDQSALQSDWEETMSEKSIEPENAQKDVTSYRDNHISWKYIMFICVISVAVSAGIATFIYWRKSNPKL